MNKGAAIIGFILSFLAGMAVMWGIGKNSGGSGITADSGKGWNDNGSPIAVSAEDPMWGNRDALVTLVLFSDYECPFCTRVEKSIEQVKQEYGPKNVRVIWKHNPLPFHKSAKPASEASAAVHAIAGNDTFWKFHAKAFENQKALTRENFEKWAQELKVDMTKFKKALDTNQYAAKVDKDLAQGKELGVRGTPHTIINGVSVNGAQPYEKFKEVIDAQLKEAKELVGKGTKADKVYVELTKKNWKNAPAGSGTPPKAEKPPEDTTVWQVPVAGSPANGPDDALLTLVIFSDFECPFCGRVEPTIANLMKAYEGKLRVVWKDRPLPFHKQAVPLANFAREAHKQKGAKGFWAAHDLLFKNVGKYTDENLKEYAKELGLNWAPIEKAMKDNAYEEAINKDVELADALKASGTPHMFINGRRIVGAQPEEAFKKLIDEMLPKAEELVKAGTPKAKVYEALMKDAKVPPPPPPPEKKEVPAPTAENPFKGGKDAKIVIQVFSDFQCPYCSRVEPTLDELLKKYGNAIKVVWRHMPLPFHKEAPLASEAAIEVFKQKGNDAFWKYHDKLFENQKTPEGLQRAALEKYAEELGCDMTKFKAALDNHTHKAAVDADAKVGETAGIRGTPAMVINGYFLSGAQPAAQFEKLIELAKKELKK